MWLGFGFGEIFLRYHQVTGTDTGQNWAGKWCPCLERTKAGKTSIGVSDTASGPQHFKEAEVGLRSNKASTKSNKASSGSIGLP